MMKGIVLARLLVISVVLVTSSTAEPFRLSHEIDAYLQVEELLGEVHKELATSGDDKPTTFLERTTNMMQLTLDQHQAHQFKPESSLNAERRACSTDLIKRLMSAFHHAILGELGELEKADTEIRFGARKISSELGIEFARLSQYLAALSDVAKDSEGRGKLAEKNWFEKILSKIGLDY